MRKWMPADDRPGLPCWSSAEPAHILRTLVEAGARRRSDHARPADGQRTFGPSRLPPTTDTRPAGRPPFGRGVSERLDSRGHRADGARGGAAAHGLDWARTPRSSSPGRSPGAGVAHGAAAWSYDPASGQREPPGRRPRMTRPRVVEMTRCGPRSACWRRMQATRSTRPRSWWTVGSFASRMSGRSSRARSRRALLLPTEIWLRGTGPDRWAISSTRGSPRYGIPGTRRVEPARQVPFSATVSRRAASCDCAEASGSTQVGRRPPIGGDRPPLRPRRTRADGQQRRLAGSGRAARDGQLAGDRSRSTFVDRGSRSRAPSGTRTGTF